MKKLSNKSYLTIKYVVLLFGSSLLIYQYLVNRSMWADEAKLALNVIDLGFYELTQPLNHQQSAPILILWISKVFNFIFGNSDYALRVTPFLIGLACLPLFLTLINLVTKSRFWSIIGFLLFATNPSFIYYSIEFKQYIADIFITLILFNLLLSENKWVHQNRNYLLGITGGVLVFLSNITPIILVIILTFLLFNRYVKKTNSAFDNIDYKTIVSIWSISLMVLYLGVVRDNPLKEFMLTFWEFSFPPKQLFSMDFFNWIVEYPWLQVIKAFSYPPPILGTLLILGTIGLFLRKNWTVFYFLFGAIFLHIVLSYFRLYPFFERFLLYTIPIIIIYATSGIQSITEKLTTRGIYENHIKILFTSLAIGYIIFNLSTIKPYYREELKPVLQTINTYKHPKDVTYVYYGSLSAFLRYKKMYSPSKYIIGKYHRNINAEYFKDLKTIIRSNNRIWFAFSHIYPWNEEQLSEDKVFYQFLVQHGTITHDQKYTGARVFLFTSNQ